MRENSLRKKEHKPPRLRLPGANLEQIRVHRSLHPVAVIRHRRIDASLSNTAARSLRIQQHRVLQRQNIQASAHRQRHRQHHTVHRLHAHKHSHLRQAGLANLQPQLLQVFRHGIRHIVHLLQLLQLQEHIPPGSTLIPARLLLLALVAAGMRLPVSANLHLLRLVKILPGKHIRSQHRSIHSRTQLKPGRLLLNTGIQIHLETQRILHELHQATLTHTIRQLLLPGVVLIRIHKPNSATLLIQQLLHALQRQPFKTILIHNS